jgi:hypothetical protein
MRGVPEAAALLNVSWRGGAAPATGRPVASCCPWAGAADAAATCRLRRHRRALDHGPHRLAWRLPVGPAARGLLGSLSFLVWCSCSGRRFSKRMVARRHRRRERPACVEPEDHGHIGSVALRSHAMCGLGRVRPPM